jgi:hypothetical protein
VQGDKRAKYHDMIKYKGWGRECVKDFHECHANVRKCRENVNTQSVNIFHVTHFKETQNQKQVMDNQITDAQNNSGTIHRIT